MNKNKKNKDVDLIFKNEEQKKIYYREVKSNILDAEKTEATIDKCHQIRKHFEEKYPNYTINTGILNWSVYNKKVYDNTYLTKIKQFTNSNVKVEFPEEFFQIINVAWSEAEFDSYFRDIGLEINKNFNNF